MTRPSVVVILAASACSGEAAVERFPNAWTGRSPEPPSISAGASGSAASLSAERRSSAPSAPAGSPSPASPSAAMSGEGARGDRPAGTAAECLCSLERDRIQVAIPCGAASCVDGVRVACDGPGAARELGACGAAEVCSCNIDLPDDTAVDLACGQRACIDGSSYACSSTGQTERGAACP